MKITAIDFEIDNQDLEINIIQDLESYEVKFCSVLLFEGSLENSIRFIKMYFKL